MGVITRSPALPLARSEEAKSAWVLWMSTLAFTVCFSVWTLYSILAIRIQDEIGLSGAQFGTLLAVPILVGSLTRLPVGMLTDRFGGRVVFSVLLAITAFPTFLLAYANTYEQFVLLGAGFGLAGAGFAVGAAYVSVWTPREKQGTALGIFGVGNVGSAVTAFGVPLLLANATSWRVVPLIYAAVLLAVSALFYLTTYDDPAHHTVGLTLRQRLAPLAKIRVWRFGLYYFLVFGGFVAVGLWLPLYYKNVYGLSLEAIGLITMAFLLPASLIRAVGGWLSDRFGARRVMYAVLWVSLIGSAVLAVPPSEVTVLTVPYTYTAQATQQPVLYQMAYNKFRKKTTAQVVAIGESRGPEAVLAARRANPALDAEISAHVARIEAGAVKPAFSRKTMPIALDVVWFTAILFVVGVALGIGKAAVYRYIPDYFPREVGMVGGIVGMIGGLGGFVLPIAWGYLVDWTGLYSVSLFASLALVSLACLAWLHFVVAKFMTPKKARLAQALEDT